LQRSNGTWTIGACDDYMKTIYLCEDLEYNLMKKVLLQQQQSF
jgi:hypothetical protein